MDKHFVAPESAEHYLLLHHADDLGKAAVVHKSALAGIMDVHPDRAKTDARLKKFGKTTAQHSMPHEAREELFAQAGHRTIKDWLSRAAGTEWYSMLPHTLGKHFVEASNTTARNTPTVTHTFEDHGENRDDTYAEAGRHVLRHIAIAADTEVSERNNAHASGKDYQKNHNVALYGLRRAAYASSHPTANAPQRAHLKGADMAVRRDVAAQKGSAHRGYGASNDHELFATTAEHLAFHTDDAGTDPAHKAPHRKLRQAFKRMMAGHKVESIVHRLDAVLYAERLP
jgi:hypothetical protein